MSLPLRPSLASGPLAFLSDIHGNLPALEAVLAELEREGVKDLYVAGDLLFGGDAPLEVWKRLQSLGAKCIRGLSDTALAALDPDVVVPRNDAERRQAERFFTTRREVGDLVLERLRRMPDRLRIPMVDGREILMVHGSPHDASVEMTHDLSDDELLALIADDPADVVICGGSHVPFLRPLDGVVVVNVGSVGSAPEGRVAHYCVVRPKMSGAEIDPGWVEY